MGDIFNGFTLLTNDISLFEWGQVVNPYQLDLMSYFKTVYVGQLGSNLSHSEVAAKLNQIVLL